jgi:hypothetical protein
MVADANRECEAPKRSGQSRMLYLDAMKASKIAQPDRKSRRMRSLMVTEGIWSRHSPNLMPFLHPFIWTSADMFGKQKLSKIIGLAHPTARK